MNYYQQSIQQVFKNLDSAPQGLSAAEAKRRLEKYGPNTLKTRQRFPIELKILLNQFSNIFFILLAAAGLLSLYLHEIPQLIILLVVMAANVAIGFAEEYKAEKVLEKLKKTLARFAWCLRDGNLKKISLNELTIGDVIILKAGIKIPADLRIIESKNLKINQAALTGESVPRIKTSQLFTKTLELNSQRNMAFAGTSVWSGRGKGVVTAIGADTQFAKIASLVEQVRSQTPLEAKLNHLAKTFLAIVVLITSFIFVLGLLSHQMPLGQLLTFVIALLVSAVPESLPTIIILTLAMGVSKMAKEKTIVKKLSAVEALGDVDVICTDKTGTLTKNEMTVVKIIWLKRNQIIEQAIPGTGFEAKPKLGQIDKRLRQTLEAAVLANDTLIEPRLHPGNQFKIIGDPTEGALLIAALKAGIKIRELRRHFPAEDELAFDSKYKYEGILSRGKIFVIGAVEVLLKKSNLNARLSAKILSKARLLAEEGLRIVGIFRGKNFSNKLERKDIKNLEFLGFAALMDPVREEIKSALKQVEKAGIEIKIITGDLSATTKTIASQIGMNILPHQIMTADQLARISDRGLEKRVKEIKIFSRVTPEQKFRIIRALQENNLIVGVTGDGVNDAPAIKKAEIGIAMGQRGTEVAQEVADLILIDDSFATIAKAVGLGRNILSNIKKFITFLLSGNFDELFLVAIAFIAGLPAPFLAVQILWINLVTDTLPALALAFEPSKSQVLSKIKSSQFLRPLIKKAIILGVIALILELVIFVIKLPQGVEYARTMVFNLAVFFELMIVFSIRCPDKPIWQNNPFSNLWLVGAIILSAGLQLITFLPKLAGFFGVVSLSWQDFGLILGVSALGLMLAEGIKISLKPRK